MPAAATVGEVDRLVRRDLFILRLEAARRRRRTGRRPRIAQQARLSG